MSLLELVGENGIVISDDSALTVDAALDISCSTLLQRGAVEPSYLTAIKQKHHEIGPYYVLAPKIAMPHARPEDGVNQTALQVTIFKQGVDFNSAENGDVYFSVTLAAMDADSHIGTIVSLSELFQNDEDIEKIIAADDPEKIADILNKY